VDLQPNLANAKVSACPLRDTDFEALYAVASDPLLWEQHPNPQRYQRGEFRKYFEGAMASRGALLVRDAAEGAVIGASRFYDHDESQGTVFVGYTFFARACWGRSYNFALKDAMLTHAFRSVGRVYFHVGASNRRSQIAMERLGASKVAEVEVAYVGEATRPNFVYAIDRHGWVPPRWS
jgi:RimJ/RimL family protein N-acetyltransferase